MTNVMTLPERKYKPWMEFIGTYLGAVRRGNKVHLGISINGRKCRLILPLIKSLRILIANDKLGALYQPSRLRILITDMSEDPVRIRILDVI